MKNPNGYGGRSKNPGQPPAAVANCPATAANPIVYD